LILAWPLAWRLSSFRQRQLLLLAISYVFYATWGAWFLAVLVASSLMNYELGRFLRRNPSIRRLWIGIVLNVLFLSFFKYLPLVGRISDAPLTAGLARIVLPIGISFWTFEALSYLFDIYREEELDPTLLEFCLYMAFWPTALSGPICRLPEMLPQFRKDWLPLWSDLAVGAHRIAVGLLMMVLSQILAAGLHPNTGVDFAFSVPARSLRAMDVWIMVVGYGFQLFFNFCGYSHLVIGAARLFGFRLAENFNRPYLSTTTSEFWTRWHMSLSFWIRDYVFFPLATLSPGMWWRNLSLVIAMFVFGLWHKGSLLFILWGTYHGLLLVAHRQWQQVRSHARVNLPDNALKPISWALTFLAISLGWIFFRAENVHSATAMLRAAFSLKGFLRIGLPKSFYALVVVLAVGYFVVVAAAEFMNRWTRDEKASLISSPFMNAPFVSSPSTLRILAQNRWVWIGPGLAVLSLYLYVLLKPEVAGAAPMLYRLF
jgi:alginate O-acetyltransferase complex protein AlgI